MNKLNILSEDEQGGNFPPWLHRTLQKGGNLFKTGQIVSKYGLNTVCEEAKCPNRFECYTKKTATFLALGKACSRACGFCEIDFSKNPPPPEKDEPERIAYAVKDLGLKHVVITMVARDDLVDGGASHMALIIRKIREECENVTIEVLTSDFQGSFEALDEIVKAAPEIFNHNLETVRRLSPQVRHKATYERSLSLLSYVKSTGQTRFVKSGIMLGLGETEEEVKETLRDLKESGCDVVTIGQYLKPSKRKLSVKSFVHPDQFALYADYGLEIGLRSVYSGPFIRSSYNAELIQEKLCN